MPNPTLICGSALSCLVFLITFSPVVSAAAPNVILIMADDLGYHDLSCYGHPEIRTPVLDTLARDGIRLTDFYAGATVCTPSRMALLTGAYPTRLGWTKGVIGYKMRPRSGLNPEALTMAEVFRSQGYQTAISGKWHLGDRAGLLPHRQGFDFSCYISRSNNQTKKLWREDQLLVNPFDNRLLTARFTHEAIRFIKASRDQPFFLYLPYTAPHFPVQAHPDWKGKSRFGTYGDVVEEMDARIGEIMETLRSESLDRKTIVVFLSDNGPQSGEQSQSKPFRGQKWDALEGGTRVPCIIHWPGVIPAGQTSDRLIAAIDILPTLCAACGIELNTITRGSPIMDGVNVWQTLLGRNIEDHPRHDLLYWHGMDGFQAIRVNNWKLFMNGTHAGLPGTSTGPALFHLKDDPAEKTDLSARFPDRVQAMTKLADKRLADIYHHVLPLPE